MKLAALLLVLLSWLPAAAQTSVPIVNGSFEINAPTGNYDYQCPPSWTCKAQYQGLENPTNSQIAVIPDGKTVLWLQGGSVTQDLGILPVVSTTYTLKFYVGSQSNFPLPAVYSANLLIGTGPMSNCSAGGTPIAARGVLVQQSLSCTTGPTIPVGGNLTVSLSSGNNQTIFDNITLTSVSAIPPNIVTFRFPVQLTTCTKCDGTDDQGAAGLGLLAGSIVSLSSGTSDLCKGTLNSNAQMSCSSGIDISPPLVPIALTVTSPDGSINYTDSQQVLGLLFIGRGVVNIIGLFDATTLQPRGIRIFTN